MEKEEVEKNGRTLRGKNEGKEKGGKDEKVKQAEHDQKEEKEEKKDD